jgi:hypothetical protein
MAVEMRLVRGRRWLSSATPPEKTPQKNRILKGCQRAVRVCDNACSACWHPVGMHSDLREVPAVSLRSPAGFHASGITEGRWSGSTIRSRQYDAMRRVHVCCMQARRVGTSGQAQTTQIIGWGSPHSVPDNAGNLHESLTYPLKVARSRTKRTPRGLVTVL